MQWLEQSQQTYPPVTARVILFIASVTAQHLTRLTRDEQTNKMAVTVTYALLTANERAVMVMAGQAIGAVIQPGD